MKVTVFGIGYVGLVQAAVLSEVGHDVCCVDIDQNKIDNLKKGIIPIFEPGLTPMVVANHEAGRITFTTDAKLGVEFGDVQFIAVGTPPDEDGSADLKYVLAVAETIATYANSDKTIIDKSTVPVGTADKVVAKVNEVLDTRFSSATSGLSPLASSVSRPALSVVSNPEFLKEGAAVGDCMRPDRIVIGIDQQGEAKHQLKEQMRDLYAPFNRNHEKIIFMDVRSAELTKYAANCMLATKISFMNEMANIAEKVGADIENVRKGIGSDERIGYHFIYPGCGYGGSCFPKDVQALVKTSEKIGYESEILKAVEAVNYRQKTKLFEYICRHFGGQDSGKAGLSVQEGQEQGSGKAGFSVQAVIESGLLKGKSFALWGLSFKPKTDDMREASSRVLMEALWAAGAKVQAFDPEAMEETQRIYGSRDDLALMGTKEAALKGADALVICTEWQNFKAPDFDLIKSELTPDCEGKAVLIDGRNLFDPERVKAKGFAYWSIGRLA